MLTVKYTFTLFTPRAAPSPPSPDNNHHHNKNQCVGSTSPAPETHAVVLQMDDDTIAHTKPFNTTLHSWLNGVPIIVIIYYYYYYFWMFLKANRMSGDEPALRNTCSVL